MKPGPHLGPGYQVVFGDRERWWQRFGLKPDRSGQRARPLPLQFRSKRLGRRLGQARHADDSPVCSKHSNGLQAKPGRTTGRPFAHLVPQLRPYECSAHKPNSSSLGAVAQHALTKGMWTLGPGSRPSLTSSDSSVPGPLTIRDREPANEIDSFQEVLNSCLSARNEAHCGLAGLGPIADLRLRGLECEKRTFRRSPCIDVN